MERLCGALRQGEWVLCLWGLGFYGALRQGGIALAEQGSALQLISGIKKTETPAPLAGFLRFLRGSAAGASGFLV